MESLLDIFLVGGASGGIFALIIYGIRALSGDESGSHDSNELNSTDQDGRNSVQREKAICSDCRDRIATYINPPLCRTCRARRSPNWFRAVKKPVTKKKGEQEDAIAQSPEDSSRQNVDQSQSSVLSCSECGHQNPAEVNFCTKCRAKMTLQCGDCGFKSPQGSEFCGSCGNETESGIKERQSREREEAKAAREREEAEAAFWEREKAKRFARERKEAKAAAAKRAPKTSFQKVRHGIANVFYLLAFLCVFFQCSQSCRTALTPSCGGKSSVLVWLVRSSLVSLV